MTPSEKRILEFGPFHLDATERVLLRDGQPVPLTLKAFEVLILLVENNGHIVEKGELLNRVWAESFVEEGNLKVTVSMLRKALEDNGDANRYIETVPRRGYRFVAPVKTTISGDVALVVHERTRQSVTIEEPVVIAHRSPRTRALYFAAGAVLIVLGLIAGFLVVRNRNQSSAVAASDVPIKSIAVLPFKPLVAGNRDEPLELGIAETLITRLSRSRAINVLPTTSVRKYTELDQDPIAAGRELQVDSVLDGNLQRFDDRLRLTVRLVRIADGKTIWAERFDEKFTDIFVLEDQIAERLVASLEIELTGKQRELLVKHYTDNAEAYQLYLKANFSSRREDRFNKSLEYYKEAVRLDPRYALAYVSLADTYTKLAQQAYRRPVDSFPNAKAAAMKALELDEDLVEAHIILGLYELSYEWNALAGEKQLKRAIELNPDHSWAHSAYATYLRTQGRFDEAINENKRSADLASGPAVAAEISNIGWTCFHARKYDEAITYYKRALSLSPRLPFAHLGIGRTYFQMGRSEEALAEVTNAVSFFEGNVRTIATLGHQYAVMGKQAEARKIIADLVELSNRKYVPPYFIAVVYAGLGDRDQTFSWLERAYQDRYPSLAFLEYEPYFDRVRNDPRFADLKRRVGVKT